jgi:predicted nucleic acid-binding protein
VSYLVDTDVVSEAARAKPDPQVIAWLRDEEPNLYVSAITIGELRRGIDRLPRGKRRQELSAWLQAVCESMKGRVLSFNVSVAQVWGQLKASWDVKGIGVPSIDSQLAATAHRHRLTLVTRNVKHFRSTGVRILNPFDQPQSGG